jgi:hypothetical protein
VNATLRKLSEYEDGEREKRRSDKRWLSHQDCKAGGNETVNFSSAQSRTHPRGPKYSLAANRRLILNQAPTSKNSFRDTLGLETLMFGTPSSHFGNLSTTFPARFHTIWLSAAGVVPFLCRGWRGKAEVSSAQVILFYEEDAGNLKMLPE